MQIQPPLVAPHERQLYSQAMLRGETCMNIFQNYMYMYTMCHFKEFVELGLPNEKGVKL